MFELNCPDGLEADTWQAIANHTARLERAYAAADLEQLIGTAKDLVETIARVVITLDGTVVASNAKMPALLSSAHEAFGRMPGNGVAATGPLRDVAQGAKTAIAQLPELRNRLGSGHGRLLVADVDEEDARMCVDLAMLWSRWALRRLTSIRAGRSNTIVTALHEGERFTRGRLREWLTTHLSILVSPDQRLVGAAVAHRAMQGTFTVAEEGVEDCAEQPDLTVWPAAYRAGLLEGLFLNRNGYVDVTPKAVKAAARIIAPHPQAADLLAELETKISDTTFANRFRPAENYETSRAMEQVTKVLPDGPAQQSWKRISEQIDLDQG